MCAEFSKEELAAVFGPDRAERVFTLQDIIADMTDDEFARFLELLSLFRSDRAQATRGLERLGAAGLNERHRSGPKPKYGEEAGRRILAVLDEPPPPGFARWSASLIAARLGDVHEQHVWRFLRAQKIDLAGRKSWCESNDPEFAAKAMPAQRPPVGPSVMMLRRLDAVAKTFSRHRRLRNRRQLFSPRLHV